MATPDPALGFAVDFPSTTVENGIRFAMQLGKHPDPDKQVYFIRKSTDAVTYWKDDVQLGSTPALDRDKNPLDPTIEVRGGDDTIVRVDYAVEVTESAMFTDNGVGVMRPTRITLTIIAGDDYEAVKDLRECYYNGDRFIYSFEPESDGLFDLAFHQLVYVARDDS